MKRVTWAAAATKDLADINAYLTETYGERLAESHLAALILSARWLLDYPGAGPLIGVGQRRKWRPRKLWHILIYKPVADGIHIVRVRHERSNWFPVPKD
jgi:plasmid stabilization system protein ParE